jgi:hypothetical protein
MKLFSIFLIVITAMILPLSLIGVGYAQQMTCWCLKPIQGKRQEIKEHGEKGNTNKLGHFARGSLIVTHEIKSEKEDCTWQA